MKESSLFLLGVFSALALYWLEYFSWSAPNRFAASVAIIFACLVIIVVLFSRLAARTTSSVISRIYPSFVSLVLGVSFGILLPVLAFQKPLWMNCDGVYDCTVREAPIDVGADTLVPLTDWEPSIAHAGGLYRGQIYTNSFEALEANKSHFELFEIDLRFTEDGRLICIHDWEETAEAWFGKSFKTAPSYSEIAEGFINGNWTPCTAETLAEWLKSNPGKRIVTDAKDKNLAALEKLQELVPTHASQIIPQIYRPDEFAEARKLGYQDIIWTLYRFRGDERDVIRNALDLDLWAVTTPVDSAARLGPVLEVMNINHYVHTINDPSLLPELKQLGVDGIYTDSIVGITNPSE